jgi:mannose/cellobiose epimerase-like protein (N-acyl-D-glucosamine 2-epimerase family)
MAAAARLAIALNEPKYWDAYDRLWAYAWKHFADHEHGAWWRILRADNSKISDEKSPAGKVDYHTTGACWDVLDVLGEGVPPRSTTVQAPASEGG